MRYRGFRGVGPRSGLRGFGRRSLRGFKLESKWCPLSHVRTWVYVSETCVKCPEYRQEFYVPHVSQGERECRFTYEWHRAVDEADRAAGRDPGNLGWGEEGGGVQVPKEFEEDVAHPDPKVLEEDEEFIAESMRAVFGPRDRREHDPEREDVPDDQQYAEPEEETEEEEDEEEQ